MQAVVPEDDKQVCYILKGLQKERREIKAGDFNDEFIEIKSGIEPGELVVLKPTTATEKESKDGKADEKAKPDNTAKSPAGGKTM
jgi:hypothetical protein